MSMSAIFRLSSTRLALIAGLLTATGVGATEGYHSALPVQGSLPALSGATGWLNGPALTPAQLKGKVVLIDFWTYSCINCIRTIPYIRAWADKYKDQGLVVIGVHTPEFDFEKDDGNIRQAITRFGITYPVAVDSEHSIWNAFHNRYWPALYFVDASGHIRHHQYGEGDYDLSEHVIQDLLAEASGQHTTDEGLVAPQAKGTEVAPDPAGAASDETYIGFDKAEGFASPEGFAENHRQHYSVTNPRLNHWGLTGDWTVHGERATADKTGASIVYRFRARDLHLVLAPGSDGKALRFTVTLDGKAPGDAHGTDTDAQGNGHVDETRLYQLIRQAGDTGEHTFEIRFIDPGASAYAFTFG
ncbi:thioredoxin family protein [Luteibacter anthropi]|uniref:thioredoxin family protein n=1 Tax=Luteibacter anthropi TaxID=564369 RepID=UPI0020322FCA|nr:thioredoxin family protein [Luteibacter anthropi]URX64449.1 thioredoxin family protein [Luteibacter anthropi]